MQFPIFKTKIKGLPAGRHGLAKSFDLNNPKERKEYFELKAGSEIRKLRNYFEKGNTFIAYLLGKKNSGKGTYSKMFAEIIDPTKIEHFSVGDMIRRIDQDLKDKTKKKEFVEFLEKNYRGGHTLKELMALLEKRSTKTLLPTDLILVLAKREISQNKKKTLFIDGFPRDVDQINFTLFFRDLIGYREDSDVFVLIDVPEKVIDERIKYRRVCPQCQTSRNLKLLPTSQLGYDQKQKTFYLFCDNPSCKRIKMVPKEGDEKGIGPIRERLIKDEKLIQQAASLYGIPKIFLRNSVPKSLAKQYVDDYEITPEYCYEWDGQKVKVEEKPWTTLDGDNKESYSLLAAPVVVSLIKQTVKVLNL